VGGEDRRDHVDLAWLTLDDRPDGGADDPGIADRGVDDEQDALVLADDVLDRLDRGVRGQMLIVWCLRGLVVPLRRPGREHEQQPRVLEAADRMALAGVERDQRSGHAFHGLIAGLDRDAARDHLHNGALAYPVIGHVLSALQVDDHESALRGGEQHARLLATDRERAWSLGSGLALDLLVGRPLEQW